MVAKPIERSFEGVRIYLPSQKSFDQILDSLLEDIGHSPVDLTALEQNHTGTRLKAWLDQVASCCLQ
jgi:hypothetical protein